MADTANLTTGAEGIEIVRTFDAPREAVFAAWTDPAQFARWFGGREGEVPVESVSMDVRPGGDWSATMHADREIPWRGTFQEVVEPERLVLTITDRPGDEYELLTVTFADLGDGRTEMSFRQTGDQMDADGYGRAGAGWMAFFDAMEEDLTAA